MTSKNSHIPTTKEEIDWIASLYSVGLVIGFLINPLFVDRIGRKKTLLTFSAPQIISWIMIILAKDCITICIARIIGGIGYGAAICSLNVYLSEIGNLKNRGKILVLFPVSINSGMLYVMILGAYLPYKFMNIGILILPIIFFTSFFFMPDSSYFCERNDDSKDVKMKNLLNYQEIEKGDKNAEIIQEGFYTSTLRFKESRLWKLVAFRNNRKALMTEIFLSAYLVFSGDAVLIYLSQQILVTSGFSLSAGKAAIILPSVRIIGSLICIPLVERVRRKVLLLMSGILGSIAMGVVGLFFFLENQNFDVSLFQWIPLVGSAVYEFLLVFGPLSLYYIFLGELFTAEVKSLAVTVCKIIFTIFTFFSLFWFNQMVDIFGMCMIFFMFSACGAIGTYIVFIITPETKGKRLDEIQVLLKSKKMFYL